MVAHENRLYLRFVKETNCITQLLTKLPSRRRRKTDKFKSYLGLGLLSSQIWKNLEQETFPSPLPSDFPSIELLGIVFGFLGVNPTTIKI
jgi:hypothetical protein